MKRLCQHLALLTVAVLTLAACGLDDDGRPVTDGQAVAFAAPMLGADSEDEATRAAANEINSNAALQGSAGFGVFASYSGLYSYRDVNVQPDFMYNDHIYYNSTASAWEYTPVRYWPVDADGLPRYVTFFAYAPYSDTDGSHPTTNPEGYCITAFSNKSLPGNPWLTYRLHPDREHQVDLLYAQPLTDRTATVHGNTRQQFQFRHALACAANELTVRCSNDMQANLHARLSTDLRQIQMRITDLSISYRLTDHARLSLWNNGTPEWEPLLTGDLMTTHDVSYNDLLPQVIYDDAGTATTTQWQDNTRGIFYIPMHVTDQLQTATVTLTYEIVSYTTAAPSTPVVERSQTVSTTLTLSDYADAYRPAKRLNLTLNIDDYALSLLCNITDWTTGFNAVTTVWY